MEYGCVKRNRFGKCDEYSAEAPLDFQQTQDFYQVGGQFSNSGTTNTGIFNDQILRNLGLDYTTVRDERVTQGAIGYEYAQYPIVEGGQTGPPWLIIFIALALCVLAYFLFFKSKK